MDNPYMILTETGNYQVELTLFEVGLIRNRRLLDVVDDILAEPSQFVMGSFFTRQPEFGGGSGIRKKYRIGKCGTAACIAGWAVTHARACSPEDGRRLGVDEASIARHWFMLTIEQSQRLFFTSGWPLRYQNRYHQAKNPEQRAKVAAARIRYFINTGL